MNETTRDSIRKLQLCGLKPSLQRVAIMQYILTHFTHPTVDEVYAHLSIEIPTLSKTTVYNTLKALAEKGAVLALTLDEKNVRYDGNVAEHAHFLCTSCGAFLDVPMTLAPEVKQPEGLHVQEVQLFYKGLCPHCVALENKNVNN